MNYIRINKLSKKPIYLQIADSIDTAYHAHALVSGDALPTEKEICSAFHVSAIVVKNAYQELINRGIIKREPGRGTFIKKMPKFHIELRNAFELFIDDQAFNRVITYQDHYTNTDHAYLPNGDLLIIYEFLMHQNRPIGFRKLCVLEAYQKLFVDSTDVPTTLHIQKPHFDAMTSYFQMINLPAREAYLLNVKPDEPAFYQPVRFGVENTFIATLENYYPGRYFVMEETHEARVH